MLRVMFGRYWNYASLLLISAMQLSRDYQPVTFRDSWRVLGICRSFDNEIWHAPKTCQK